MSTNQPFEESPAPAAAEEAVADASVEDGIVPVADEDDVLYEDQVAPQYGVLGIMTLRELLITAVWLIAFVVSFFPVFGGAGLWTQGVEWILPIGLPTVGVFLLLLRRFSPDGIRRVGSLGIDQFASVVFSVAAVYWTQYLWSLVSVGIATGHLPRAWVPWVEFVAMLGLVVLTVFAPLIPGLREDFHGRLETLAHRNADPARPVIARPRAPKPSAPSAPPTFAAPADPNTTGPAPFASAPPAFDAAAEPVAFDPTPLPPYTGSVDPAPAELRPELDAELSGEHTTDEVVPLDPSGQVPLSAHASGGDVGAVPTADDGEYRPGYARRSRRRDTATGDIPTTDAATDAPVDVDATNPRHVQPEPAVEPDRAASSDSAAQPDSDVGPAPAATQPFWALAPTERYVVDELGAPLFRIGPTAWALVIEDRGGAYVIRHDDGRIGYLHDIADMMKG